ncbi:MAG: hypothetical protein AB9834_16160 [Lentimicrobium sp.]
MRNYRVSGFQDYRIPYPWWLSVLRINRVQYYDYDSQNVSKPQGLRFQNYRITGLQGFRVSELQNYISLVAE